MYLFSPSEWTQLFVNASRPYKRQRTAFEVGFTDRFRDNCNVNYKFQQTQACRCFGNIFNSLFLFS